MRSRRGLAASLVFLLALPLTALCEALFGTGTGPVIHGALALGSALMAFAVFDFDTPKWATWVTSASVGVLAGVFFLQGLSELIPNAALAELAYHLLGQWLEGGLVELFMAWCVLVWVVDAQVRAKTLGIVAMATVASVRVYSHVLAYQGTSLDAQAPMLKVLWLLPFVWLLFESMQKREAPIRR